MLSGFAVQTDNQLGVGAAKSQVPATIAASCEQQVAAPKVEVGLQEATVVESQQYNIVELSELSKQFNNTHVDEGEVLGLTFFNYGYELELSFPNVVSATQKLSVCDLISIYVSLAKSIQCILPKSTSQKAVSTTQSIDMNIDT